MKASNPNNMKIEEKYMSDLLMASNGPYLMTSNDL